MSANKKERREALDPAGPRADHGVPRGSPQAAAHVGDMLELLGDRPVALCRELTKLHEETIAPPCPALWRCTGRRSHGGNVLVVAGAEGAAAPAVTLDQGVRQVQSLRQEGQRMKDAVRRVAEDTGLSRNELYQAALQEE